MLVGNAAVRGGGIFNQYGTVHVVRSILRGNFANNGGGIANSAGTVVVRQCTISSNTANPDAFVASGGGIYNESDGSDVARARLAIVDSTIEGNLSGQGGGISNVAIDGSTEVGITNSTISGNSALCHDPTVDCTGFGGGMYHEAILSADPTTVYVVNSTFAGNISASPGTGIFFGNFVPGTGRLVIASSMFESGRSNGPILNISAQPGSGLTSLGHNVCRDSGSGFLTNATDQTNTDPMLGPLQDNGGPTFTHAPLPGSPAIDKGRNLSGSTTDQRGFPRTVNVAGISNAADGDGTDVGAMESQDVGLRLVNSSVVSNRFGFNLIGPFSSAVVEGSTSLSNWTALATNMLTDAPLRFSDPSSEPLRRFYRARVQ
jgi:hypothetical protein